MTLTRRALARKVAEELGSPRPEAYRIVRVLFEAMRAKLIAGDRIEARGFGTLGPKMTAPRPSARNLWTGEITPVPARRRICFKPGKKLREALSEEVIQDDA